MLSEKLSGKRLSVLLLWQLYHAVACLHLGLIIFIQRLLAMQWLRVQVVKEGRGAGDRAATDVKMDVDSDDDDSVGDGVQQEILDFVVNVCPSKSTESVTWLGPLAVSLHTYIYIYYSLQKVGLGSAACVCVCVCVVLLFCS